MSKNNLKRFECLDRETQRDLRKYIVWYLLHSPILYSGDALMTVEQLNEANREKVAEHFYNTCNGLNVLRQACDLEEVDYYQLIDDIACYVDLKMPPCLYKKQMMKQCKAQRINYDDHYKSHPYLGIETLPGATFKFAENYQIDKVITASYIQKQKYQSECHS